VGFSIYDTHTLESFPFPFKNPKEVVAIIILKFRYFKDFLLLHSSII
jgi:hypothetical protein